MGLNPRQRRARAISRQLQRLREVGNLSTADTQERTTAGYKEQQGGEARTPSNEATTSTENRATAREHSRATKSRTGYSQRERPYILTTDYPSRLSLADPHRLQVARTLVISSACVGGRRPGTLRPDGSWTIRNEGYAEFLLNAHGPAENTRGVTHQATT